MSYKKYDTFFVYMHTNKINSKVYIGITRQEPTRRWAKGNGYRDSYFYNAIKKYGWDNFEHVILYEGLSKEDACRKEKELISHYDSTNRDKGYNIASGGDVNIFEHKKGQESYWYGKHHTLESKKKISENNAKWLLGKKRNRELVEKIRVSIINSPNRKKLKRRIICIDDNNIYDSIQQASKTIFGSNNHRHAIKNVCEGIYQGHNGYHFRYIDDNNQIIIPSINKEFKRKERFIQLAKEKEMMIYQ